MKINVDKALDEARFLTILKKDGSGRFVYGLTNVKQFEKQMTPEQVQNAQYILFTVTEGALTFGDSEPGDVLGEAVRSAGVMEDQAAMIASLTEERDTALRAAENANQLRIDQEKELEAVRKRLREVTDGAMKETGELSSQLATAHTQLADAGKVAESLRAELRDTADALKKAQDALLEEQTKPRASATPTTP